MLLNKKFIIGWVVLGTILFISYYLLGGFTEVKISHQECNSFYITGKAFKGNVTDKRLDSLVEATHRQYSNGVLKGKFSICFYGNPDEQDTLEVFVGTWHEEAIDTPNGYRQERFAKGNAIFASIEAEAVVAPSATETNEKIKEYALKNNLSINGVFIERYDDDYKIVTIVPVKSNI